MNYLRTGFNNSIFPGEVDIAMSLDGDLMLDDRGDLALVDGFEWLTREVNKRIRTNNPDWRYHSDVGASLEFFIGLLNTEATSRRIRSAIDRSLAIDNIGFPGSWDIQIFPIGADTLSIIINLSLAGVPIMISRLIYDYRNGAVQPIEDSMKSIKVQTPLDVEPYSDGWKPEGEVPNKYQKVIGRGDS